MPTVTKKELIDRIADKTGQKRTVVKNAVQRFLDEVILELGKGNRLEFRDFGVFEIKQRAPRTAQNPKTMVPVAVPARKTVKFKLGRLMRDCLDDPAACADKIRLQAELERAEEDAAESKSARVRVRASSNGRTLHN